jgi:hypothetical protein
MNSWSWGIKLSEMRGTAEEEDPILEMWISFSQFFSYKSLLPEKRWIDFCLSWLIFLDLLQFLIFLNIIKHDPE